MKRTFTFILALSTITSNAQSYDVLRNTYSTVAIGNQEWMGENLRETNFLNGEDIFYAKTEKEWIEMNKQKLPAYCYSQKAGYNNEKYGLIYNWYAVSDLRGLAPEGWHIPSETEWLELASALGGNTIAGAKMKRITEDDWAVRYTDGDLRGFAAYSTGCLDSTGEWTILNSEGAYWWCYSRFDKYEPYLASLAQHDSSLNIFKAEDNYGYSVRCVKNTPSYPIKGASKNKRSKQDITQTLRIGHCEWVLENLNVVTFRNGDTIPAAITKEEWINANTNQQPAWCFFDNDASIGKLNGRLYNYYALSDPRGLIPEGYRMATNRDWDNYTERFGGEYWAGVELTEQINALKNDLGLFINGWRMEDGTFWGKYIAWWTAGGGIYNVDNKLTYLKSFSAPKGSGCYVRYLKSAY